ncbi:MAG: O-succinylbenzoic acid--CoA ligase, partial [Mycobacteriaceae bacterium]|nr:O-succinylbenzoic acid--CoA ligase [Mycobacteriaceae bacterium]
MSNVLQSLPIPAGRDALGVLDALRTALAGAGPALAPMPAGDERETARL